MTDHDHHQADDDEAARVLAELDARRLPASHEVARHPPAHHALALVAAADAAGVPVSEGRFVWRTARRLVADADGIPAGIVEHRSLVFTNTEPARP